MARLPATGTISLLHPAPLAQLLPKYDAPSVLRRDHAVSEHVAVHMCSHILPGECIKRDRAAARISQSLLRYLQHARHPVYRLAEHGERKR